MTTTTNTAATISTSFLTAGRAEFTVDNGKGEHFTFKVLASKRIPNRLNVYRVAVGRHYMGGLQRESLTYVVSNKGEFSNPSDIVNKVFAFALRIIAGKQSLPENYSIRHAGKCGRCGRKLTDPTSIASGIGPDCAEMMKSQRVTTVVDESSSIADAIVRPVVVAPVVEQPKQCNACGGTGQFVSRKTGRPSGACYRCQGKGVQTTSDTRRNYGYDNFYRGRVADGF